MAIKYFNSSANTCGVDIRWDFVNNATFCGGVFHIANVLNPISTTTCNITSVTFEVLYLKTWVCPSSHPYFNLTSNLCQDICSSYYFGNTTTY